MRFSPQFLVGAPGRPTVGLLEAARFTGKGDDPVGIFAGNKSSPQGHQTFPMSCPGRPGKVNHSVYPLGRDRINCAFVGWHG